MTRKSPEELSKLISDIDVFLAKSQEAHTAGRQLQALGTSFPQTCSLLSHMVLCTILPSFLASKGKKAGMSYSCTSSLGPPESPSQIQRYFPLCFMTTRISRITCPHAQFAKSMKPLRRLSSGAIYRRSY